MTQTRITVVVPAFNAWRTLPTLMEALRPHVDRRGRELVLVESSGVLDGANLKRRWPWAHVVALPDRTRPGRARNLALEHAGGELIAFIDADAIPEPGWLDELERSLTPDADAVAGAVDNGTPSSAVGTVGYLLEFAEWLPGRSGHPPHAAACNLLIRREVLERVGGFPVDLWPGEDTVVTAPIAAAGRLVFAPAARVRHINRTGFRDFVAHQFRLGWSFSEVCERVDFDGRAWGRLPLAPLTSVGRAWWLWRRLHAWDALPDRQGVAWPAVCLGSCVWAAGLTAAEVRRVLIARGHRSETGQTNDRPTVHPSSSDTASRTREAETT